MATNSTKLEQTEYHFNAFMLTFNVFCITKVQKHNDYNVNGYGILFKIIVYFGCFRSLNDAINDTKFK
jgi:hypothetical protein